MADLSSEELMKDTSSIYEAVVVMCRRARQVNDEQKLLIDMQRDSEPVSENKDNEDFDDVEIDREALMRDHIKLPKPSRVAMEEMAQGKINFKYLSTEDGESKKE